MFRIPVSIKIFHQRPWIRMKSSSSFIRNTYIDYFVESHGHKHIKSSSVVPLCDPTVPFVNAGMNQFKGVFLGKVDAPWPRAVNSQKCVRVGGKHNDLDVVGTDGHHHTFFEMLGNWSFGDYYKKEACQMAWDLLLGPYRLKPEDLVVTYFAGDVVLGLPEDRECRDVWKDIGVPESKLKALGSADNFWEMGASGPCGPCTEIHFVNKDGSLTEIWNIVFIQFNREVDGSVKALRRQHVDTGMGLERVAALLQGVSSNYDTDLFQPIIKAIEKNSKGVPPYGGRYGAGSEAALDCAYRRLADHSRMIAVCLADGVFPATSLNLKQIMRKSFKMSTDVFQSPHLLSHLYDQVLSTLGATYPELVSREKDAKLIISHEEEAYRKMRGSLAKKWKDLVKQYPEVETLSDVETPGFTQGYKEFKETMSKRTSSEIPGELVFKLYDTHGFQEDIIEKIAQLNHLNIDKKGFWQLLAQHKTRHKTALMEQSSNRGLFFDKAVEEILKKGPTFTNEQPKYEYTAIDNEIKFKPLKTTVLAILNEDLVWIDHLDPSESKPYYLVTKDTNFYCEEGGQIADSGVIQVNKDVTFNVHSVFKIRDFVFHKGYFSIQKLCEKKYVSSGSTVVLEIDATKRVNVMRNHTAVHLLNAAIRKVLPNSVVCQIGSSVTDKGLYLNLSVYGEKLSQAVVLQAQDIIRNTIQSSVTVETRVIDNLQMLNDPEVLTVPGETYPETGLRLVTAGGDLVSKELCCGTHVPSAEFIEEFCVTLVRGAGGHTPTIHALTSDRAKEAREIFWHAAKVQEVIDLVDPERLKGETGSIKKQLAELCGTGGAPYGEYANCLALLDSLQKKAGNKNDMALQAVADEEIREASLTACGQGRRFVVHFLRCSYLMQSESVALALAASPVTVPTLVLGCAGGVIVSSAHVPQEWVSATFDASRWLGCVLPVFGAAFEPAAPAPAPHRSPLLYAQMTGTKVSLITCEQLVQDAMRIAIKFAQAHLKDTQLDGHTESPTQGRRHN